MKEDRIIKQLGGLKGIEPDAGYAAGSKLKLIHQTPQRPGSAFVLSESLNASLSIGLVMVLFIFIAVNGMSNIFRSPISPAFEGVSEELAAEAGEVNSTIDIHLEEVEYLTGVTNTSVVQAIPKNGKEGSDDEEIDDLLNEAKSL